MKKLLIFDADGTLFDSRYVIYKVWLLIAKEYKRELFTDYTHFKQVLQKYHAKWEDFAVLEFSFKESDFEKIVGIFIKEANRLYASNATWYDNMINVLTTLEQRGYVIAVATNNSKSSFVDLFKKEGMNFPIYDQETHKDMQKPEPNMILDHISDLGFSLENTVMIGDSLMDLQSARAAKVLSVWAKYGSLEDPLNLNGLHDHILETPNDLLELFN